MKLLAVVFVALVASAAYVVGTAENDPQEPQYLSFGQRGPNDELVDMYYAASVPTDVDSSHTVEINWEGQDVSYIGVYIYYDFTTYQYTGLPSSSGRITVTNDNARSLEVTAYIYGKYDGKAVNAEEIEMKL